MKGKQFYSLNLLLIVYKAIIMYQLNPRFFFVQAPPGAPLDFASELARKLGGAPAKTPSPVAADNNSGDEWEDKPKKKGGGSF